MWRITHALVVVAALLAITPTYAQSAAEFYAGKQITLIVGASTGGGYDTQARLVARHLGKHIPGNPTIIVQNMPAAGSLAAANHIYNVAAKDGSVFALVMRGMLLIKHWSPASARFDLGHLNWVGSINSEVAVAAAWHTAPHKTVKDLFDKELIVGGHDWRHCAKTSSVSITPRSASLLKRCSPSPSVDSSCTIGRAGRMRSRIVDARRSL